MSGKLNRLKIKLDKSRTFVLDIGAVARFESNTGKAFFRQETWQNLSREEMVLFLWACLAGEDAGLRPVDVLKMFENGNIDEKAVIEKLNAAWGRLIASFIGGK
jgi:hypothetical protein